MIEDSTVTAPELREELRRHVSDLAADDPRRIWQQERREGLVSGIDEAFHFFFDDHDFDESGIGFVFFNDAEVAAVGAVKGALDALLRAVGDMGDDEFVQHRLWRNVTAASRRAEVLLSGSN